MTMPSSRLLFIVVASIATWTASTTLRADESGEFLDIATLQPESRAALERMRRPMTYAQIVGRDRTRREDKPLVDFAFAFSRAVAGREHSGARASSLQGDAINRKQDKVAASMQHQDVVIAELEARETQITKDLEVASPLSEAPASKSDTPSVINGPDPLDLRKALKAVPASRTSGWSGMTLAVQGVALRFVDEGGAAPVQYR
jgi:hypothetical protein